MKSIHKSAASLPDALTAQMKKGITDRGKFLTSGYGGDLDKMSFVRPTQEFKKPSVAKFRGSDSDVQFRLLCYRTEKAIDLRDELFASLVRRPLRVDRVEDLASHLVRLGKKGVPLAQFNWAMGNEMLKMLANDLSFPTMHQLSRTRLEESLSDLMSTPEEQLKKNHFVYPPLTEKTKNILQRLKLAHEAQAATTTTTATTGIGATSTSTTTSTIVSGTSNTSQTTLISQSSQGTQGAQAEVDRLDVRLEAVEEELEKAIATVREYRYADPPVDEKIRESAEGAARLLLKEKAGLLNKRFYAQQLALAEQPPRPAGDPAS